MKTVLLDNSTRKDWKRLRALEFWKHIPDFWIPSFGKSNVSYPCLQMKKLFDRPSISWADLICQTWDAFIVEDRKRFSVVNSKYVKLNSSNTVSVFRASLVDFR